MLAAGLPLCRVGAPLETPLPYYDRAADDVMCYVAPTYGDNAWNLPPQAVSACIMEAVAIALRVDDGNVMLVSSCCCYCVVTLHAIISIAVMIHVSLCCCIPPCR